MLITPRLSLLILRFQTKTAAEEPLIETFMFHAILIHSGIQIPCLYLVKSLYQKFRF